MKVLPIASDSLGVRSMATYVETKDCKILIDPSAALGPKRYGLPPSEQEIDALKNRNMLEELKENLIDRFGPIPKSLQSLLKIVTIRWIAEKLGFEKLILKNQQIIAYFINNQDSHYYKSETFVKILNFVQRNPQLFRMKESTNKLTLMAGPIESVDKVNDLFIQLHNE